MTTTITQTCNKCKKERTLRPMAASGGQKTFSQMDGGWRPFGDKDVCPDCLNAFVEAMG